MLDNIRDKSRPIGLRAEDPHIYELAELLAFCRAHTEIYIYGTDYPQQMLWKLLKSSPSLPMKGFMDAEQKAPINGVPVVGISEAISRPGAGVILGLPDRDYRYVIPKFKKCGFTDYYIPTEWNKRTIAEKMTPRDPEYNSFEISLTDHCNMSCQMCDHYAQLSEPWCISLETLDRDLKRMYELCDGKCAVITLLGGEPLLHPQVNSCLEITRRNFPETPLILLTNGLLLLKLEHGPEGNIWELCRRLNVTISITRYPIRLDYGAILAKAKEYGVELLLSSDIHSNVPLEEAKVSYKHTFTFQPDEDNIFFPACHYFNHLGVVKDGRYYMCPVSAHVEIFNRKFGTDLNMTDQDSMDIFQVEDWEEIARFQAERIPFCCYCDIQKWGSSSVWKPSANTIEEYT